MYNDEYKEVDFKQYCKICKHWEKDVSEDPCFDCLAEPANLNSHKPVKFEASGK